MSKYYLISKTVGKSFSAYTDSAIKLSTTRPYTYDEVVVGIKSLPTKVKKITTFRDSSGKIIERAFDYFAEPYRNILYTHRENIIGEDEFVTSVTQKEYTMKRGKAKSYLAKSKSINNLGIRIASFWQKKLVKTEHVSENINNSEKILSTVTVEKTDTPAISKHKFVEYPHILDKHKVGEIKSIEFDVNEDNYTVIPNSEKIKGNVSLPNEDSFLGYRALEVNDSKIPFVKHCLQKRKLENVPIMISTDWAPKSAENQGTLAIFSCTTGSMLFNKYKNLASKAKVMDVCAHETEHVWQYFLDARYSDDRTPWQDLIYSLFGRIKDQKLKQEAIDYTISFMNYVPFNGKNYLEYMDNFVEKKANEAGEKAMEEYLRENKQMRDNFSHIPTELL